MTKTLKQLQEEHPEWCFICGTEALLPINHEGLGCYPLPMLEALTAAKREDEKRIAELEKRAEFFASLDHAWAVGMQEKNDSLQSQLTAAQATIAERDATILEKNASIAELRRILNEVTQRMAWLYRRYISDVPCREECERLIRTANTHTSIGDDEAHSAYSMICAHLRSEKSDHAATKEELRKAEETIQQQARELEEVDEAIIKAADSEDAELVMERIYQAALARQSQRADEGVERVMSMTEEEARRDCESRGTTLEAEAGKVREVMHRAVQRAADAAKEE